MQRPVNTGPRLTKKARERKHEQEKADKALGGGQIIEDGEDDKKKAPHWWVELQWFKLLRGDKRLYQIARILVELAPAKLFDPRDTYNQHLKNESATSKLIAANSGKEEKGDKKEKKLTKKEQIILANQAKKQKEAVARDTEKLKSLGSSVGAGNIKLSTESGKLLLLLQILKKAVLENNVVDVLDTMWEIEEVTKDIPPKEAKSALKPFSDVIKQAAEVRKDRKALGGSNIFDFQLSEMSDRLPPLNLHSLSGKFRLDDWQLHVINLINENKSVFISAPTSSGKTVLSTYVCTTGAKVLFVVPSEPLAWQVAAMLRALKLDIAITVPTLTFVPAKYDVTVGTPHALETALTKQIGFDFEYAVFDEVHSLNNSDGAALERIIRSIPETCKVMALSATINNAPEVIKWWENIIGEGNIELVVHTSRFINLQRYIWTNPEDAKELFDKGLISRNSATGKEGTITLPGSLQLLHPVSSLSVEYLQSESYKSSDIAFTPVDAFMLYKSMDALLSLSKIDVSDLKPKTYFKNNHVDSLRITLMQAKVYEDCLKERLVEIAKQEPELCSLLIASVSPGADLKQIKKARKNFLANSPSKEDIKKFDLELAEKESASVRAVMNATTNSTSPTSLCDLCYHLLQSNLLPAICFQLDSVRAQFLFDGLLRELEEREIAKYPTYKEDLENKAAGFKKMRDKLNKSSKGGKETDDAMAEAQEFGESSLDGVDVEEPHPEFSFVTLGRGMGSLEASDVKEKLGNDLKTSGDAVHPLIRGLRRGIGIYIEGLPSSYLRTLQSFAQQGRLGLVLSDELLAYGVNMPFRTCIFYGDPGADWLTPLIHQQMAGRAGRRGLDRQGHLIYAGFEPKRLQSLLRGQLPDVVGRFPLYPTIPLQLEMNKRYFGDSKPGCLTTQRMNEICSTPLAEFIQGRKIENYYNVAEQWIEELGVLKHPESSYKHLVIELIWDLRQFLPESFCIEFLLDYIIRTYKDQVFQEKDADLNQQVQIFLVFCSIVSRTPYDPNALKKYKSSLDSDALKSLEWIQPLPAPLAPHEEYTELLDLIKQSQDRIKNSNLPYKENILLPHGDSELDNLAFSSFVRNKIDPSLPTPLQHECRKRIWAIGEVMRICSNTLGRAAELMTVQNLIRKCFIRIRYILDETSQRNWKKMDNQGFQANDDEENIDPPSAP